MRVLSAGRTGPVLSLDMLRPLDWAYLMNRMARIGLICLLLTRAVGAVEEAPISLTIQKAGEGLALEWKASESKDFVLEQNDDLRGGAWLPCPPEYQWPASTTNWKTERPAQPSSFYRVRTVSKSTQRGQLLSLTNLISLEVADVRLLFTVFGLAVQPNFGVDCYRVTYQTLNARGEPAPASGLLALPKGSSLPLPLLSYQHGTLLKRDEVPSRQSEEYLVPAAFASLGYVAMAPDYIGMGDSPGFHPYMHAHSAATAVVDLLRAARQRCAEQSIPLNQQLFLVGYSQGGQATMAAHREIHLYYTNEFQITATAPMAGPHDLSGTMFARLLSDQAYSSPYYLPYTLFGLNTTYQVYRSYEGVLAEPYATQLPLLLDGHHSSGAVDAILPPVPKHIFRPEFLEALQTNPQHPFRRALRQNDLLDWAPSEPMRLFHCRGDDQVPFANSEVALARFHAAGATHVQLVDPSPNSNHVAGFMPSLTAALQWFQTLKR